MKKTEQDEKLLTVSFRNATVAFVAAAVKSSGKSRPDFFRDAVVKASEKELGKTAPIVAPFVKGRTSALTLGAKAAGLSSAQYMRKLACEKLGIPFVLKGGKRAKKR